MKEPANVESLIPTFCDSANICDRITRNMSYVEEKLQNLESKFSYFTKQIDCRKTKIPEAMLELHLLGKQVDELEKPISAISENYRELKEKIKEWGV